MQEDFHYYATYCAAFLAGYSHEESLEVCYSAQFVDLCSRTLLSKLNAPGIAATTQLQLEMMDARTDILGLQDITRIWSSFHFLPYDLYADKKRRTRSYMHRYRLICKPNGSLLVNTVEAARGRSLQHVGIAMHVLADTWAHSYFAGTPSLVINNTDNYFYEIKTDENGNETREKIKFRHNPSAPDDLEKGLFTNTLYQSSEISVMNLGHGRAGHLPDYSFIKYAYLPAWDDYREMVKDNPSDYYKAFAQMVYAMKCLRQERGSFHLNTYSFAELEPYADRIKEILTKRQLIASEDWKAFGEELSGKEIPDFDIGKYQEEYVMTPKKDKDKTFIGEFITGAIVQKSMVTNEIFRSGSIMAGFSKEIVRS